MAESLQKHRLDARNYSVDYADEIASTESLSGTPAVEVFDGATDVTTQFSPSNVQIDGTTVEFTLAKASGDDQDGGRYDVRVTVSTDGNQELVTVHALDVDEQTAAV